MENLQNRKHKNLNKTDMKRKCMDNSSRKCQKEFITIDLGNGYPKVTLEIGTEALLCAAQEQAIRRNFAKSHIVKTSESPLCRLCGKKGQSVQHLVGGCEKLAKRKYKRRQNNVAKQFHCQFCKKSGL